MELDGSRELLQPKKLPRLIQIYTPLEYSKICDKSIEGKPYVVLWGFARQLHFEKKLNIFIAPHVIEL